MIREQHKQHLVAEAMMPSKKAPLKKRTGTATSSREKPHRSDSELIQSYISGNDRSFGELVERYQERLINFVLGIVRDRERAEDLAQETFLRVFLSIRRYDNKRRFSTWLYTIAKRLAINELRNLGRNRVILVQTVNRDGLWSDDRSLNWEDPNAITDKLAEKSIMKSVVSKTLNKLSQQHRNIIVLVYFNGMTYEEVGGIMGCKVGTVKSRLNRARSSFARIISAGSQPK